MRKYLLSGILLSLLLPVFGATISMSDDGEIKRHQEDGEIITVTLSGDEFNETLVLANWSFSNLPSGVSVGALNRISATSVQLVLSGNSDEDYSKNIIDFTTTVLASELKNTTSGSLTASSGVVFNADYWILVWSDEFDGSGLPDNTKWSFESMKPGTVNNELQNYVVDRTENARQEDGNLIIECRKDNYQGYPYSSARLRTITKGDWLYAKVQVGARLPSGKGTWPAIWMLPSVNTYGGWPNSGEIDIMEHVGVDQGYVHATIHTGAYNHTLGTQKAGTKFISDCSDAFHEYTVDWKPEYMSFYYDSENVFTFLNEHKTSAEWPYDKKFYLILNIAYGGDWGGYDGVDDSIFDRPDGVKMYIDYVRVYKNLADLFISGPDAVFENDTNVLFSIEKMDGLSYNWLPSDGYDLRTAADSNSVSVDWKCETDTIQIEIIANGTERYVFEKIVTIKPYQIQGRQWVDTLAQGVGYTVPLAKNAVYTWSATEGIDIISGQGTNAVIVDFGNEGDIRLQIETNCGIQYDTFPVQFGDGQFAYALQTIPGKIVAGYFDTGGEGIAYHDSDPNNNGGVLRPDEGVDLEAKDGSYTIGWSATGEWIEYTVDIISTQLYDIKIMAGGEQASKIRILQNGVEVLPAMNLTATGSWNTFKDQWARGVELLAGKSVMRIEFVQGGSNLGDMTFMKTSSSREIASGSNELLLFPNPVTNALTIQMPDSFSPTESVAIKVYDLQGKEIYSVSGLYSMDGQILINLSSLEKGFYVVKLGTGSNLLTGRLIKI